MLDLFSADLDPCLTPLRWFWEIDFVGEELCGEFFVLYPADPVPIVAGHQGFQRLKPTSKPRFLM